MTIIYLILVSKEEKNNLLKIISVNLVLSLIYIIAFTNLKRIGYNHIIWIITTIMPIISGYLYSKIKINKKIDKIFKIKYLIIFFSITLIIIFILSMFKSELALFNKESSQTKITKNIYNVKENNKYKIELEIEAKSNNSEDNYTIEFIQRNNYSDNLGKEKIEVSNFSGIKEVNIDTKEGIKWIEFSVFAHEKGNGNKLIIKSLKINGKQFTLNYKFLPTDIISQLKYIDLSQRSVQERKVFIIDGINILKKYGLLGIGGDGYRYAVQDVQSYYYGASQMHCYVLQIVIEFGILGLVVFCYIIILTAKNIVCIIKKKEKEQYCIIIALVALFLHSLIDFDMTFLYVLIIFYSLIAMVNFNKEIEKEGKADCVLEIVILIVVIISTIFNTSELYVKYTKENALKNVKTYQQKSNLEKKYILLVPYNNEYKKDRIEYIKLYREIKENELTEEENKSMKEEMIKLLKKSLKYEKKGSKTIPECIEIISNSNNDEDKREAYIKIDETLKKHRYNVKQILSDYEGLKRINDEKVKEIVSQNIDNSVENLKEYQKCRITEQQSNKIIVQLKSNETRGEHFD